MALALGPGLRPGLRVLFPELAVQVAWRRGVIDPAGGFVDPWGGPWHGPPIPFREDGGHYPRLSGGPDGVDETVFYDAAHRINRASPQLRGLLVRADGRPPDEPPELITDDLVLRVVRVGPDGVTPLTSAQVVADDARRSDLWAALERDLLARGQGPARGDDVLVARSARPDDSLIRLLADHPLERWLGLGLFAIAWLVGARPRAARDRRLAVEAWRVLLLASLPGAALAWAALRSLPAPPGPTLLVSSEVAACASAAGLGLLGAVWLRLGCAAAES